MPIQTIQPLAGNLILPSNALPIHNNYRWINSSEKAPFNSSAVPDNVTFFAVEIQGAKYAVSIAYESDLFTAKNEIGEDIYVLRGESAYVVARNRTGSRYYFTTEAAAEAANFKFSIRLGEFCDVSDKEQLYGNDKVLRYHTSQGLSDAQKKALPKYYIDSDEYLCGLEVEKTDSVLQQDGLAWEIAENSGWIREQDGSLGTGGFELVSPILPLFDNVRLNAAISHVEKYINGNSDASCGGHINISRKGKTNEELLDSLKSIAPVLYSLYPNRLGVNYCKAKKWKFYFTYPEKYSAFYLKPSKNIVEIRLFGKVKNVDTLKWRIKLLQLLLPIGDKERNLNQIAQQIGCTETAIYKHFLTQYTHAEIGQKIVDIDRLSIVYDTHKKGLSDSVKKRINSTFGYDVFPSVV